jgi:2-polyprenyl-3-methyl-5-hydroxy-6-metoxy-1,4-benzoquinol methylase
MLDLQEAATKTALTSREHKTVLDVGGGHGQLALPLLRDGYQVTVHGSSEDAFLQIEAARTSGAIRTTIGPLTTLPFPDRSFDAAISFRIVSHLDQWSALLAELSRVARYSVIIDYPSKRSVNAIADGLFALKQRVEGNTRPFTVFRDAEIRAQFERHGFAVQDEFRQFFLPMAAHRAVKNPSISSLLERGARSCGLTTILGSPVILHAVRAEPSVAPLRSDD